MLGILVNNGVKASEMEWLGLEDKLRGKPKVTKDEVLKLIHENGIELQESILGDSGRQRNEIIIDQNIAGRKFVLSVTEELKGIGLTEVQAKYAAEGILQEILNEKMSAEEALHKYFDKYHGLLGDETKFKAKELDKYIKEFNDIKNKPVGEPVKYGQYTLPGEKSNYREMLIRLPEAPETSAIDRPSESVAARHKTQWDDIIRRRMDNMAVIDKFDKDRKLYSQPGGGEQYRAALQKHSDIMQEQDNLHDQMIRETVEEMKNQKPSKRYGNFQSEHFEEPNILAHTRFDDRMTADGKRTLFVEEVQSDWHQKGKREGYKGPEVVAKIKDLEGKERVADKAYHDAKDEARKLVDSYITDRLRHELTTTDPVERNLSGIDPSYISGLKQIHAEWIKEYTDAKPGAPSTNPRYRSAIEEAFARQNKLGQLIERAESANIEAEKYRQEVGRLQRGAVPDAPFKSDWQELVMKRMLRYAAENGYDSLSWVTGEQTAERYDLSKQVSTIRYYPKSSRLMAFGHEFRSSSPIVNRIIPADELPNYIGKDAAQKLLSAEPGHDPYTEEGGSEVKILKDADLKVGGEWAKNLYDRAIPRFLDKYAKKWGTKVGEAVIPSSEGVGRSVYMTHESDGLWIEGGGHREGPFPRSQEAEVKSKIDAINKGSQGVKVHSIPITPDMRNSVMKEGQPIARSDDNQPISRQLESIAV